MLTREEIRAVYDQGPEAVIALVEGLYLAFEQLQSRDKALEDWLANNRHNSSKPPSSDGFAKQMRSLREPSTHQRIRRGQVYYSTILPAGVDCQYGQTITTRV